MSQANVEIVSLALEAFSRGDAAAFADLTTEDVEWTVGLAAVEGEVFRGWDGVARYFDRLGRAWDEFRFLAEQFCDLVCRLLLEKKKMHELVLIHHPAYDQCFHAVQLVQVNMQAKYDVIIYLNLPSTRHSVM